MQIQRLSHFLLPLFICGCVAESRISQDAAPAIKEQQKEPPTGRVTGIGGVFFKAHDPKGMAAWYTAHLGIQSSHGYADFTWREKDQQDQIGHTAWAVFPTNSAQFGQSSTTMMIDYRVSGLDQMLEKFRHDGIKIEKVEDSTLGRFAWIMDPEGNRIELWEPKEK